MKYRTSASASGTTLSAFDAREVNARITLESGQPTINESHRTVTNLMVVQPHLHRFRLLTVRGRHHLVRTNKISLEYRYYVRPGSLRMGFPFPVTCTYSGPGRQTLATASSYFSGRKRYNPPNNRGKE